MGNKGFTAKINCIQPIPCNPCETSCPFGAIYVGDDITNLPSLDEEKCMGCGICVATCPGIAIIMYKKTGQDLDYVALPYEYDPLPEKGDFVTLVDGNGTPVGTGRVDKIKRPLKDDPTNLVYVEIDSSLTEMVAGIGRFEIKDDPVICRCEEIKKSEIVEAIAKGDRSVDAIKRRTRSGMGSCQGRSCSRLIAGIIAENTGLKVEDQQPPSKRPPVGLVSIDELTR